MYNLLKMRKEIFDKMLECGHNKKNWEMLCCSDKPLVPFIGAGVSAWCYPMWKQLLIDIVREAYSEKCVEYVNDAWECAEKPEVNNKEEFLWTEEIAECIFDEDRESYDKNVEHFSLREPDNDGNEYDVILQSLRDYVGDESRSKKHEAVRLLYKKFSDELLKQRGKVPEYQKYFPILFPDILVTTNYDNALNCSYPSILSYSYTDMKVKVSEVSETVNQEEKSSEVNINMDVKKESSEINIDMDAKEKNTKNEESKEDFETNVSGELREKSCKMNKDIEVDIKTPETAVNNAESRSWLYCAVQEKLKYKKKKLSGKRSGEPKVTIPEMPMLLKVHGSIERASELALTKTGYDKAYNTEIKEVMKEIFEQSTLIFIGYGLARDRIMHLLEEQKKADKDMKQFAFLPIEQIDKMDDLEKIYGVYPIYYDKTCLMDFFQDENERNKIYHDYFLGILMENLARRKKRYPQPLELLWEKDRYNTNTKNRTESIFNSSNEQFVRSEAALQIWKVLEVSDEYPLVAVVGKAGSGKSTLCRSIQKLQKGYNNPMQFFYVSLANCKSLDEFFIRIYQELNIVELETSEGKNWREFARKVNGQCAVYWRSVLVLDYLDELKSDKNKEIWDTVKNILKYWKEHKTRVVFTCQEYPEGIPCYIWQLEKLGKEDATKVFFNACTTRHGQNITYLEKKVVEELFARKEFWPSAIYLLGKYAGSKSDLTSLLDEWNFYFRTGDKGEQTVARILWNHMLDGHKYDDLDEGEKENVRKNILWVWGILGTYPGVFPREFFEIFYKYEDEDGKSIEEYKKRRFTQNTLMIMKNIGLCEEKESEKQNILLENIVDCVRINFVEEVEKILTKGSYLKIFNKETKKIREDENRLKCFRGFLMRDLEISLRKYILDETHITVKDSKLDILDFLEILGEKIKNSEGRSENPELSRVLHYEIKTVTSFLWMCNSEIDNERIVEVGYLFSNYYHYMPNYAYPVVKMFLQIMQDKEEKYLYQIAGMSRVMGDIQRLMGRKADAAYYYNQAIDFCHRQISKFFDVCCSDKLSKNEESMMVREERRRYEESLRIKAGVLITQNDNFDADESDIKGALKLYELLDDNDGKAYYNQRIGEFCYTKAEGIENLSSEMYSQIKDYYNEAKRLYRELKNETGSAYIWKCQGDLEVKFKRLNKKTWFKNAVNYYYQAFIYYYRNISWRGFANVMQAMNTCLREYKENNLNRTPNITLYNLAEECYRWIGDIRGLADTLDYEGHELKRTKELKGTKEGLYKYMALGKWSESRELWYIQDNKEKIERVNREISGLWLKEENDEK